MREAVLLLLVPALAACTGKNHKPDLPGEGTAVAPELQIVERIVYVPIPAVLTKAEPIAEGPITQCFAVAAERRAALQRCNAKLKQVDAVQGTEVEP